MTEPSALPPARIADLLAASAATVVAELVALGDEGGWRPEPGEWSANECVGHLIEAERRGFAGRIRPILAGGSAGHPGRPRRLGPAGRRRGAPRPPAGRRRAGRGVRRAAGRRRGASSAACARRPRARRDASGRRTTARRRAPRRVGPPRPEPHPPDAGGHPGARLGPDGQRPPVQPRGPLGELAPRRSRGRRDRRVVRGDLIDAPADDAADDRADDVDPQLVQVAADEGRADRPGRVDRRAGDRRDREVDGDERQRDRQGATMRCPFAWTRSG